MWTRRTCVSLWPTKWSWWLAAALLALTAFLSLPALAKPKDDYHNTPAWTRLVTLWHLVLDHSSGVVYSPDRFKELGTRLDRADTDVRTLEAKGLPKEVGDGLVWMLRARYAYVKDRCYGATQTAKQDDLESAEAASEWVVEMQLGVLRDQCGPGSSNAKLEGAVRRNLVTELTFQHGLQAVRGGQTAGAEEGKDEAAQAKLAQEATRRKQTLLAAYERRDLPRDRTIQTLVPYLVELTKAQPDR